MRLYFFNFLVYILCSNPKFLAALRPITETGCVYTLHLFNDNPAILDVPTTVSAFLECADDEDYLYIFEDDLKRKIAVHGHQVADATFTFSDRPGLRTIKVSVYIKFPEPAKVASKTTTVEVHEYIPGKLEFSEVVKDVEGQLYAAAGKKINITLELDCPRILFHDAEFSYSWTIGDCRFTSNHPYLVHHFTDTGPQWIRVAVVARIPSYDATNSTRYKWGYFNMQINVKYPFTNINITGNTYLQHGQLLNLDISCNGSGPVDYCWKVLPPSENRTNLSCTFPVTVAECSFPIIYYFQQSGDYLLAIYVDNLVSRHQRNIEIHIYDVSLRPQLSTVIIPVVCTILVLLIVASAVVIHVRRNKSYDIETADFDFMVTDECGTITIETSWEYMHRSFLHLLRMPFIYYSTQVQLTNYGTVVRER